jgi:S1-C subfamily serine protease
MIEIERMPVKLFALVFFCLTLSSSAAAQDLLSSAKIFERASSSVVLIATNNGVGSGFLIEGNGTVVTASHVIEGATRVSIKTANGEIYEEVSLLANDPKRDFAILKIKGFDLPSVSLGNSNQVVPGENVTVIGTPLGEEALKNSVSTGVISGIRDLGEGYRVIQITAPVSKGNSGGPVFNGKGEVVGLVAFRLVDGQSLNFIVPINYVRGVISDIDIKNPLMTYGTSSASSGVSFGFGDIPRRWISTRGQKATVRIEGDLLIFQLDQSPLDQELKVRNDFGELFKAGDVYAGTYFEVFYTYYPANSEVAEFCIVKGDAEVKFSGPRRFELKSKRYRDFDDLDKKKCTPKKGRSQETYYSIWIPE